MSSNKHRIPKRAQTGDNSLDKIKRNALVEQLDHLRGSVKKQHSTMPGNAGRGGGSTQVYALGLIVLVAGSFLAFTVFFPGPLPFGSGSGQKSFLSTCIEHSAVDAHYH